MIHVSLLKPHADRREPPAPRQRDPVIAEDGIDQEQDAPEDHLFHIERFIDSQWFGIAPNRVVKYRVRWQDYKPTDDTWQTIEESGWPAAADVLQAYRTFHDTYRRKVADPQVVEALAACICSGPVVITNF